MTDRTRTDLAAAIMRRFAERTSVAGGPSRTRRYLWTDAFAVCNFLALHRATGDAEPLRNAVALTDLVHDVLGRHRPDDSRGGWISGLPEPRGRLHPTRAGLRIGKPRPERGPEEPFDDRAEWDRDGQYFHYLTRWMHALARLSAVARDERRLDQAVELAAAAHAAFVYSRPLDGARRMRWKMSIDLRRSLVASMGQHDPLDGLLGALELRAALETAGNSAAAARLDGLVGDFRAIEAATNGRTDDPLGLGGLLAGSYALAQLVARGQAHDGGLLQRLLGYAAAGLDSFVRHSPLGLPARFRLAFRELGLAIGLAAVGRTRTLWEAQRQRLGGDAVGQQLEDLRAHVPLAAKIERAWLEPRTHDDPAWTSHVDINEVMLATSLLPDGYLEV